MLISDSDLEAFCLDYFPEVQRRFANQMERTTKVNLLLERAMEVDIMKTLQKYDKDAFEKYAQMSRDT